MGGGDGVELRLVIGKGKAGDLDDGSWENFEE